MKAIIAVVLMLFTVASYAQPAHKQVKTSTNECVEHDTSGIGQVLLGGDSWTFLKCVRGKWVDDVEAMDRQIQREKDRAAAQKVKDEHNKELWNALRTRVVTDAELLEVLETGTAIMYPDGHYICSLGCNTLADSRGDQVVFQNALLNQFKMRVFAALALEIKNTNPTTKKMETLIGND